MSCACADYTPIIHTIDGQDTSICTLFLGRSLHFQSRGLAIHICIRFDSRCNDDTPPEVLYLSCDRAMHAPLRAKTVLYFEVQHPIS